MNSERQLRCIELQDVDAALQRLEAEQRRTATLVEHYEGRKRRLKREIHLLKEQEERWGV